MRILWIYGVHEHSGYARCSREFIKAINERSGTIKFYNMELSQYPEIEVMKKYEAPMGYEYDMVVQNVIPPCFKRIGNTKNVLMTFAETDRIRPDWVAKCNEADEIWTLSYFSKFAFVNSGVTVPIKVVRMPIDANKVTSRYKIKYNTGKFTFFANSEWTPRKGWDILLKAFYQAFHDNDVVQLLIKTCCFSQAENRASVVRQIQNEKEKYSNAKCKVLLDYSVKDINEVWGLYGQCDAYVLPSRGEACGIPYMEAMCFGLPVIHPDLGGQIDYMNSFSSIPVKSNMVGASRMAHNPYYDETMKWVETDPDDLANKMILAVNNPTVMTWRSGGEIFRQCFDVHGSEWFNDYTEAIK